MSSGQESAKSKQAWRIGTDIGGTFTDLIMVDASTGKYSIGKTLTTPDDPSMAVESAIADTLLGASVGVQDVQHVIHGTTLVTNALIERKGAKTALLTTAGFKDAIEIGRETRYDLYDLMLEKPKPLVPRHLRFDVPQRNLVDGSTHIELDKLFVERLASELKSRGIEAVAVSYLHSFTNPVDEEKTREIIARVAPELRVSISSEIVAEIREYERTTTTIANVYVAELVERYLRKLEQRLRTLGFAGQFYLMHSSGGIATVETTVKYPVRLLESGPAAGALAATALGERAGISQLLSFDMGGTTAKICVVDDGKPMISHDFEVDRMYRFKKGSGLPIKLPVIELIEIGTGGGSKARVDSLGLLKVGPDSAGAKPGPVSYGLGGKTPTLTDANLILGYLDADYFLGGRMQLRLEDARTAISNQIAEPLGLSVEQAAWGIHQIANENMANAARVHALERGKDPRKFPLFAFGGGGPMQAYRIALAIGCPQVIVPLGAGVLSTLGFLTAPLAFDFVRSWTVPLSQVAWNDANAKLRSMEQEGEGLLDHSGVSKKDIHFDRSVDMRYIGQGHEISVALPNGNLAETTEAQLRKAFEAKYQTLYGRMGPPVGIEIINWRVVCSGPKPNVRLTYTDATSPASKLEDTIKRSRLAFFPEANDFVNTPVIDRYALAPGMQFVGPAIIEERESTMIVGPDAKCSIDEHYNLVVEMPITQNRTS